MKQFFAIVEDIKLNTVNDVAYKFEGSHSLAEEDQAVTEVEKMRPLQNAGEIGF